MPFLVPDKIKHASGFFGWRTTTDYYSTRAVTAVGCSTCPFGVICTSDRFQRMTNRANPEVYEGRECNRCGSTIRLTSNKQCRRCNIVWSRRNAATRIERNRRRGTPCDSCSDPMDQPCCDVDPVTEKPRGWLCHYCNKGLGMFKDDIRRLELAIAYLRSRGKSVDEPVSARG